jgi:hypothetical protein
VAQVGFAFFAPHKMKDTKRGVRTESLSLRIDPKTKFILEFMVRVTGYRITDLIEMAIKDYANKTTVESESDFGRTTKNWLHYWHPDEGTRTIKLIFDKDIRTNFEEDEIADFIEQHAEFFFSGGQKRQALTAFIQVLWPKISEYVEHWRENKAHNRWATGLLMLQAIRGANMRGPVWPKTAKVPAEEDLNDEIPF